MMANQLTPIDVPVTGLENGVLHKFRVYAQNALGDATPSNEVEATPARAPDAPVITELNPSDGQIEVIWSAPVNNGGEPVDEYRLEWSSNDFANILCTETLSGNPPATTYTVTGLTNGDTYYFRVIAINEVGESDPSDVESAIPVTVPAKPVLNEPVVADSSLTVSWSAPYDGGSPLTGYTLSITDVTGGNTFPDVSLDEMQLTILQLN